MTDFELLTLYRECHVRAQELGLRIDIGRDNIHVIKDNETLISKMKITQIDMFLEGYKCGCIAP